jgi:hypothetical protein
MATGFIVLASACLKGVSCGFRLEKRLPLLSCPIGDARQALDDLIGLLL